MSDLTIFSAGSFRHVIQELIQLFKCKNPMDINAVLAPAGLLRQRIEQGEHCDIFISANLQNIIQLSASQCIYNQQILAFNRLMLTTRDEPQYKNRETLDMLLDPHLRLATSTPIADPGGDYTWQLFDLVEKRYPKQGEYLKRRALQLVGGEKSIVPKGEIAAEYLLKQGYADVMVGYANYQAYLRHRGLCCHLFPPEWNIKAIYAAAQLNENSATQQFFQFLTSAGAAQIMYQHGFLSE